MRPLNNVSELEIRDELRNQAVLAVHRVTVTKNGEVISTSTLFLTFNSPDLPREIKLGYLRVKVDMFVPNPLTYFNCNGLGHTSA